jgi:ribonuclease Z
MQRRFAIRQLALALIVFLAGSHASMAAGLMDSMENRTNPGPPRNFAQPGARSHLVLLGTGNPLPNPWRRGPGTAIIVNGTPYLVDAGEGIWRALAAAAAAHGGRIASAFEPAKLRTLFITHQHADHTIGIPALMMMPWYLGRQQNMTIYGPPGISHTVSAIREGWRADVETRLAQQIPPLGPAGFDAVAHDVDIADFGLVYEDENLRVEAWRHHHIDLERNYAYRFTLPDRVVVIGGDGTGSDALLEAARGADVLVAEVATEAELMNAPWGGASLAAREKVMWAYHTRPRRLAEIAREAGVRVLVLYHTQNYSDPFDNEALLKELRQFYDGEVVLGRDGDLF